MAYHHHLNYFQLSPVRGQLEPEEPAAARTGWRFIQCTDTPNQLKVLLPPRTATLYAHLLKLESHELSRGSDAQWQRVMEIRHLKDRMIRKCQRLAQPGQQTASADVAFRTVYAPPDFRLKEMERWLKGVEPRIKLSAAGPKTGGAPHPNAPQPHSHNGLLMPGSPLAGAAYSPGSPPSPEPPLQASFDRALTPEFAQTFPPPTQPPDFPSPEPPFPVPELAHFDDGHPPSPPPKDPEPAFADLPTSPVPVQSPPPLAPDGLYEPGAYPGEDANQYLDERTFSPDPLPVPYRHSRVLSPLPEEQTPLPEGTPLPPASIDVEPLVLPPEPRPLVRRRSSLKRTSSSSRLSASGGVAWAMDLSRTEMAAREVEIADLELRNLRELYRTKVSEVKQQRFSITDALQRLHLQEEALRIQEEQLNEIYQELEEKEAQYSSRVLAVVEESKRVVQAKKDMP